MQDFPPVVRAFLDETADPPVTRSPRAFLMWLVLQQRGVVLAGFAVALVWMVPQALGPWLVGRAIDSGLATGHPGGATRWLVVLAVVTLVGALSGIVYHTVIVRQWLFALYGTTWLVTHKTLRLGHVLGPPRPDRRGAVGVRQRQRPVRRVPRDDFSRRRAICWPTWWSPASSSQTSLPLGLLVLLAAPLLVLLAPRLLRPLQRRPEHRAHPRVRPDLDGHRHRRRAAHPARHRRRADLRRQLRAPVPGRAGGRRARRPLAGRRRGRRGAPVGSVRRGPALARHPRVRRRRPRPIGELVTFLGYGLFLVQPIRIFFEFGPEVHAGPRLGPQDHRSSSATTAVAGAGQPRPRSPLAAELVDEASGLRPAARAADHGRLRAPDASSALADRLGRYLSPDDDARVTEDCRELKGRAARVERPRAGAGPHRPGAPGRERARQPWGVTVGGVDLSRRAAATRSASASSSATAAHTFAGHPARRGRPAPDGCVRNRRRQALHHGGRRGRLRHPPRRLAGGARRARARPVRRPAAAAGAHPGARGRPAGARPGRADLGGGRAHRGAGSRSGCPGPPSGPHDGGHDRLAAAAAPRRRGGLPPGRPGGGHAAPTTTSSAGARGIPLHRPAR